MSKSRARTARTVQADPVERVGLLGVFECHDAFMAVLENASSQGITIIELFSPVPDHHAIDRFLPRKSPVRYITAAGAVSGLIAGFALALLTARVWNLTVGGKPVMSIVPVVVVGFELTILFGAIATLAALFFFGRLPFVRFPSTAFREGFTNDRFGIWMECDASERTRVEIWLREIGAVSVESVGAQRDEEKVA